AELIIIIGEPGVDLRAKHSKIANNTILRKEQRLHADGFWATDSWKTRKKHVSRFLDMFNGDWTVGNVVHICQGPSCCANRSESIDSMFSAAVSIDMLMASDTDNPSEKDWSTCGAAAGKVCFGIACHDVLSRLYTSCAPSWRSAGSNIRGDGAEIDRLRLKTKRKTWRAKLVLSDVKRKQKIFQVCYLGYPVERMMAVLQHRDGCGKLLYDLAGGFNDDMNPLHCCLAELPHMVTACSAGPLGPIIESFLDESERFDFLAGLRAVACNFASGLAWRFELYRVWPYKWAK
ncbi:unnamed protein product, partial [Prorocentrum cordatum]